MKRNIRIIAKLEIKGPNVIKGVNFEGLRVIGRPELFAPRYYEEGIDELIFIDTVASLYGRNNIEEIVRRAAEKIYVPLTVGGGVRTVDDIRGLLRAGADKVAINTASFTDPDLITKGALTFGAQCIVASIQAKKYGDKYECLTDNARERTKVNVLDWAKEVVKRGAGEILLSSVDRDGTGKGYDIELVKMVSEAVDVPVIASGGAGEIHHFNMVIQEGKADAVCAASIFHYKLISFMEKYGEYKEEGNTAFLKKIQPLSSHSRKGINACTVNEVKKSLITSGVNCRISNGAKE